MDPFTNIWWVQVTPSPIIVDGNAVDPVEEFTYLGSIYSRVRATPDRNISGALDSRPVHWKDSTVSRVRASSVSPRSSAYTPRACYPYYSMAQRSGPSYKPTGINWIHSMYGANDASCTSDFVSNDEVLHRTGLFDVSYIVCKRRLGLFGHVARLRCDVQANQILRICTKSRDGERPSQQWRRACARPSTTCTHQICRDTGVTATEALQLAEDRPFWRTIATARGSG